MASKTKTKSRKIPGQRRFNVDFPLADMAAFKDMADKSNRSMAAWARAVLRKAAGRAPMNGRAHKTLKAPEHE